MEYVFNLSRSWRPVAQQVVVVRSLPEAGPACGIESTHTCSEVMMWVSVVRLLRLIGR